MPLIALEIKTNRKFFQKYFLKGSMTVVNIKNFNYFLSLQNKDMQDNMRSESSWADRLGFTEAKWFNSKNNINDKITTVYMLEPTTVSQQLGSVSISLLYRCRNCK